MIVLLIIAIAAACWVAFDVGYGRGERAANERWVRERVREEIEKRREQWRKDVEERRYWRYRP